VLDGLADAEPEGALVGRRDRVLARGAGGGDDGAEFFAHLRARGARAEVRGERGALAVAEHAVKVVAE
jgi:hypothetical protein